MKEAAAILGRNSPLRILSFGCSTGAECLDAADIFPNAEIIGLDVNGEVLNEAMNIVNDRISFALSTEEVLEAQKPFDLILAMNVFCRYPLPKYVIKIDEAYPFGLFVDTINLLHDSLKVGGILSLYNTMYFFNDCPVSSAYSPVMPCNINMGWMPKFYPDGEPATTVDHFWEGKSHSYSDWVRLVPKDNKDYLVEKHSIRHRWINPRSHGSRRTDVALWYKRRL